MAYEDFIGVISRKFPGERAEFWRQDGRHIARVGGYKFTGNSVAKTIEVKWGQHRAIWTPETDNN